MLIGLAVGCTPEQANKIIELRPFTSVDDLNAKLGQGRKKAGPAGISPRMFEDSETVSACHQSYSQRESIDHYTFQPPSPPPAPRPKGKRAMDSFLEEIKR